MSPTFTDDDVGKRLETASGETVGVVTMTEPETAYVDLESGAVDSIKATLGWDGDTDEVVPIDRNDVRDVTTDAVVLESGSALHGQATEDGSDPVAERTETTVHEDEGSERRAVGTSTGEPDDTDETSAAGEGRSGKGTEPETEAMTESGAERHPESEEQPPQGERTVTKDPGEEDDR
ncbi:hypothetical protein GS429_19410 [Natronorubrum sp. JWXQ-INN-674]|uniref:Uncharacterized protein n=1 Tax=Natronorubrum halalkaliphilum TaxID=2691917 RepID=A0A6B0VRX3_9EURY|nr:hypothetical protein [Natronorubrum halalkaliphilum]MXV64194.1 hypothetical protein [Natronorubrum halalkaliphilum]